MSVKVTVDGKAYTGVNTVEVGGKSLALESDVITPSGTKTITENGTYDVSAFASVFVNVAAESGGEIETGTIVGNDSYEIEIPVTGKKSRLMLWGSGNTVEDYANTAYVLVGVFAIDGWGHAEAHLNYNGTAIQGAFKGAHQYPNVEGVSATNPYCYFEDGKISIRAKASGAAETFLSSVTYNWCAW